MMKKIVTSLVSVVALLASQSVFGPVKGTGYRPITDPPDQNITDENLKTTVFLHQTSRLVLPRERELDMAVYAANRKIKTLDKGNISRDVHANESQWEIIELQRIIQMSIINETQFEITFHGSRIVQGRDYHMHIEYYKNNTIYSPDIEPWPFIVRFAEENVTSIKPTENEMQPTMASVNYSSTGNTTAGKKGAKPTEKEMQSLPFSPSKGLVHTRNPGKSPSSNKLILVLAISGSILVVFIVLSIYLLSWRHKNKKRSRKSGDVSGTKGGGFELQDC